MPTALQAGSFMHIC